MKYRKKPVVVEAFKWTGDVNQLKDPMWIVEAIKNNMVCFEDEGTEDVKMLIKVFGKVVYTAHRGDYIINQQDVIYPCKPDMFNMTYEPEMCCELNDVENKPCQFCGKEEC